MKLSQY